MQIASEQMLEKACLYDVFIEVFDRCTDTTPFIDSLRVSYNRMLEKRLI